MSISPIIAIRERPPVNLTVNVTTPGGYNARWAADDPNPANQPQSLTFTTTMPGGFTDLTCTLERDPKRNYLDVEELSMVTVRGIGGGQVAWQGRQEALPDTGGSEAQISPQCSGWQNHLTDNNSAAMIYIDQQLTNWSDPPLNRQIVLQTAGFLQGDSESAANSAGAPALVLEYEGPWTTAKPLTEAWYDSGIAGPISQVWYLVTAGASVILTSGSNFELALFSAADDAGSTLVETVTITTSNLNGWFTAGNARFALMQFKYGVANAGIAFEYQVYCNLAVAGNHGLTFQGTTTTSPGGLLASDVIAHAVSTWAPLLNFTTGTNGTIQPSAFPITQLAFTTPGTAADIIKQAIQYELLDWAVWEGPIFYLNPFGQGPTAKNWRTRVGECQLQQTGPDITQIYNGVIVQYTLPDGTNASVGPPGSTALATDPSLADTDTQNPANEAGINRWYLLQMGTSVPTAAIQAGAQWLQAQKTLNTSGQASLVGHAQDDRGVYWPSWMVRAGDTLTVVDASNTTARRIVSTSYDDTAKTNTVQLDQPPATNDALLQRMSEAISTLGLS